MTGQRMEAEVAVLVEQGAFVVPKVVGSLATHFPRHVDRSELVRAGMVGLVEAAHRFDASRGIPFERFAVSRIRGAVLDALRADDWVPRSLRAAARRLEMVETSLTIRYGRKPTTNELAAESGISSDRVEEVKALRQRSALTSLERSHSEGTSTSHSLEAYLAADQLDAVDQLERSELFGYLREAISELPDRQRRVILGQFVEGRTTIELASELGITRSRVSQLRTVALHELRRSISGHYEPHMPKSVSIPQPASFPSSAASA